jgi:hypothetical protein
VSNTASPIGPPERFEITRFLEGRTRAWGVVEDRFGRVRQRISVEMSGTWSDGHFRLDERFSYGDGRTETRTWVVVPGENSRFTANCDDCVGVAEGQCHADSIHMRYRFRLKLASRDVVVAFDDRIYRMGDREAVNRARISKWGVEIAELTLFFVRDDACEPAARRPGMAVAAE